MRIPPEAVELARRYNLGVIQAADLLRRHLELFEDRLINGEPQATPPRGILAADSDSGWLTSAIPMHPNCRCVVVHQLTRHQAIVQLRYRHGGWRWGWFHRAIRPGGYLR